MIIIKEKNKNSKIYVPRTVGEFVQSSNSADGDFENYYTKDEVDDKLKTNYYNRREIDYQFYHQLITNEQKFLTEIPDEYATKQYADNKVYYIYNRVMENVYRQKYLTAIPDEYVTTDELVETVDEKIGDINNILESIIG